MREIDRVAIIGKGIIGLSWALVFARAGLSVRVWNRSADDVDVRRRLHAMAKSLAGTGLDIADEALDRIAICPDFAVSLDGAHYVQESITEDIEQKRAIFSKIENLIDPVSIVASSTSGLLPSGLAAAFSRPERFLVVHPLTPPHLLPITEIVPCPHTAPEVLADVEGLLRRAGQHPILLHAEISGFALNRILGAMMNEIFALVREGVLAPEDVDPALTQGFGLRWSVIGPLAAMDLNAPNGIREYLGRYASIFETVAQSRGMESPLDHAVIEQIAEAISAPGNKNREEKASRRDRAIARIRAFRDDIIGQR